jgi:hypothetical protein
VKLFNAIALRLVPLGAAGLAFVALAPTGASGLGGAASFDAQADFVAGYGAGANPNGVWSYAWSEGLTGAQHLFPNHELANVNNDAEQMWDDPSNNAGFTPSVARNSGGDFADGNVTFDAGALIMHPCGTDGHAYAHTTFTAPADGRYSVTATFTAQQNGDDVDVHVLVAGASRFASTITGDGQSRTLVRAFRLTAGQTIDFAVGPDGHFGLHPGNTALRATIIRLT